MGENWSGVAQSRANLHRILADINQLRPHVLPKFGPGQRNDYLGTLNGHRRAALSSEAFRNFRIRAEAKENTSGLRSICARRSAGKTRRQEDRRPHGLSRLRDLRNARKPQMFVAVEALERHDDIHLVAPCRRRPHLSTMSALGRAISHRTLGRPSAAKFGLWALSLEGSIGVGERLERPERGPLQKSAFRARSWAKFRAAWASSWGSRQGGVPGTPQISFVTRIRA